MSQGLLIDPTKGKSVRSQNGLQLASAVDRPQYEDGAGVLGEGTHPHSARYEDERLNTVKDYRVLTQYSDNMTRKCTNFHPP